MIQVTEKAQARIRQIVAKEGGEGALATLVIGVGAEIVEVHARVERRLEQPNGLPADQRRAAAEDEAAAQEIRPAELAVGHAAPLVAVDQAVGRRVLGPPRRPDGRRGSGGGGGGLDECPAVHLVRRGHNATPGAGRFRSCCLLPS